MDSYLSVTQSLTKKKNNLNICDCREINIIKLEIEKKGIKLLKK